LLILRSDCRMWDAFDFATVSLTVTEVAKEFDVENSEVTWVSYSWHSHSRNVKNLQKAAHSLIDNL
jgi:hypothetical protein